MVASIINTLNCYCIFIILGLLVEPKVVYLSFSASSTTELRSGSLAGQKRTREDGLSNPEQAPISQQQPIREQEEHKQEYMQVCCRHSDIFHTKFDKEFPEPI